MTVNNVNALLAYAVNQAVNPAEQASAKQDGFTQGSFGQVMSKVNDTMGSLKAGLASGAVAVGQTNMSVDTVQKEQAVQGTDKPAAYDSGKMKDMTQQDNDGRVAEDAGTTTEQAVEEVEKSAKELVEDIAEEMDVTPEEVEEAMAVLGLTAVQLFDVDNLKQLLLQISGSTDELSLVTDATLYGQMQDLFAVVEESLVDLQEELGLSEEELSSLIEQIVSEDTADMQDVDLMQDADLEGMKDYTISVQKNGETVQVKVTVDDASGSKSVQEEVTDSPKEEVPVSNKARGREASADSDKGESNASHAFLQTPDKPMEAAEAPAPVNAGYQSTQTEDIMNQIMDYMKINLKADTQQMELQLHPASLGTINVQIVSKDGAITAQFTTQNEMVRAAVETQLIQLKNQFEEQGLKVDAVEVTVANHEYGQQFSQNSENAEQKQGKSAKAMRRINLEELDGDEELAPMDESERIAVEMMQANGSTVDYTA